ncbi:hypothetical protein L2E82_42805 [Cichorium intybus]|uniref:Uncharacterized protein n=1 Tax=Cichorium intybus TaxID=13427 RepID=A0ACB8ZNT5_CICIN|nr:hypothetical protein L2E82_42805 [Cichorium intybus]
MRLWVIKILSSIGGDILPNRLIISEMNFFDICLSEPCDTIVLPCRHMCMCIGCAKVLRFQTNRCLICRRPVERLLEIKENRIYPDFP